MGQEEFAKVLENIVNNSDAAEGVAAGDFSSLEAGELTDAEQALLSAAAGELDDDVAGFGDYYLKLGDIDGDKVIPKLDFVSKPQVRAAFSYLKLDTKF